MVLWHEKHMYLYFIQKLYGQLRMFYICMGILMEWVYKKHNSFTRILIVLTSCTQQSKNIVLKRISSPKKNVFIYVLTNCVQKNV